MSWPKVHDEFETLTKLKAGFSIARFGDGEFKMMDGAGYVREPPNPKLAAELQNVLRAPHANCLRGIPTFDARSPKFPTWVKHTKRFTRLLHGAAGPFYSAFISRPDSAPWIRNREFALEFVKLWEGKRVSVLCEPDSGALRMLCLSAPARIDHIECPHKRAYKHIDRFEEKLLRGDPQIIILSCGMTATCLANRLAGKGVQTIDFGSGGSFIAKLLMGDE
jgi:hypothetical protein